MDHKGVFPPPSSAVLQSSTSPLFDYGEGCLVTETATSESRYPRTMEQQKEYPPLPLMASILIWLFLFVGVFSLVTWGAQGFPLSQVDYLLSASVCFQGALMFWLYKGSTSLRDDPKDLPNARWKPLMYPIGGMIALYFVLKYFVA